MKSFFRKYKKGLITGFAIGAIVTPLISSLGIISHFFEILRPILVGPMDLIKDYFPDRQISPNTFEVPIYKWVIILGFNGICYAILGAMVQCIAKKYTKDK